MFVLVVVIYLVNFMKLFTEIHPICSLQNKNRDLIKTKQIVTKIKILTC